MRRNLLTAFLIIGIFTIFNAISAQAQTNLPGKYVLQRNQENGQDREISIELKGKNIAVYSNINNDQNQDGMDKSFENTGSWAWNKSKKLLTVTYPAKNKSDGKVRVTFKLDGNDLKVVKVSPVSAGEIGDVFKKV